MHLSGLGLFSTVLLLPITDHICVCKFFFFLADLQFMSGKRQVGQFCIVYIYTFVDIKCARTTTFPLHSVKRALDKCT